MPIFGRNGIGIANAFKGISSFLNPDKAYRRAGQESERAFGQAQQYLHPYEQQGQAAYQPLNTAMQNLLNPGQLENQWRSEYQMSPYARMQQEMAKNQGLESASSMGLMGSTPALQAIQAGTNQIGAQDQERYLDRMMQKYGMGVQLAHGLYNQGGQFASQLGANSMQQGQNRAGATFGQYGAPGEMFGNLLGLGAGMYGAKMGAMNRGQMGGGGHSMGGMGGGY
jgi:hypothetical protein